MLRSRTQEEERIAVGGYISYFRECLKDGVPCEGDGDLSALWVVAARSPGVCAELMAAGLSDLFSPEACLPTVATFAHSREWGCARFS